MQGQQGGYNARAILAMAPVQRGQQCHSYNGKDACASTMVMTPLWQGWGHQFEDLIDAIAARATTIFRQWQRCWTAKTPAHQWRQQHRNEGNNPSLTTAKMPAHWWQRRPHCYEGNNISLMTTLAWLQQRRHRDKGNNRHRNDGKDACTSTATTPSRASITIATMVKTPAHQRQRCHHDEGDDASFTTSDESNDDNSTTAETPAYQGWQ
jgi:hypothetical protein